MAMFRSRDWISLIYLLQLQQMLQFALSLYKWKEAEKKRWVYEIINVEAAFLERDMEEQIGIKWPDGFLEFGFETQETMKNKCVKLEKAMYGSVLKSVCYQKINDFVFSVSRLKTERLADDDEQ